MAESNKNENSRRRFLRTGAQASAVALAFGFGLKKVSAATCGLTPAQTPGPFYPGESEFHPGNDLTLVQGHSARATGPIIYVQGTVLDSACRPIKGANIEIWQACASGRYNNTNDTNPAALDPNFQYWGETSTDASGSYIFKSILPGAYPADTDWMRPPHIHFKINKLGYKELVTQLYFKGNPYNDKDLILRDVPASERDAVVIDFKAAPAGSEPGSLSGTFDITLASVRR